MANGNLQEHLSGKHGKTRFFTWEERLRIAVDAASGLEYLQNGCKTPIIHRDVKSTNILLNENFQAKLSDFGLSKIIPTDGITHVSTVVAGTPGYLDPDSPHHTAETPISGCLRTGNGHRRSSCQFNFHFNFELRPNVVLIARFVPSSGHETRNHHHQSTPLHVRNKTPLFLVSAVMRRFPATVCHRHPPRKSISGRH